MRMALVVFIVAWMGASCSACRFDVPLGTLDAGMAGGGSAGGGGAGGGHACVPSSCEVQARACGTVADGCGGWLSCGGCGSGTTCDGKRCVAQRCTDAGWCWENPLPQGNPLQAAWAFAENDVWAVGGVGRSAGVALHFDGTRWSDVGPRGMPGLLSLWASSPTQLFAGAVDGSIWRFDGAAWAQAWRSPVPVGWSSLSGTGPSDVWALRSNASLAHFDGERWEERSLPHTGELRAVLALAPGDVWLAGYGRRDDDAGWSLVPSLWHFDGAKWSPVPVPEKAQGMSNLRWAVARSSDDVWFGGGPGQLRWNGSEVELVSGEQAVFTAGRTGDGRVFGLGPSDWPQLFELQGSTWRLRDTLPGVFQSGEVFSWALAGTTGDDLWLVGRAGARVHFDGQAFDVVPEEPLPFHLQTMALADGGLWVGGERSLGRGSAEGWQRQAIGGAGWVPGFTPSLQPPMVVAGTDVLRFDRTSWVAVGAPLSSPARIIDGVSPRALWLGGAEGLWFFDGERAERVDAGVGPVASVLAKGAQEVWVGGHQRVARWNGSAWNTWPLSSSWVDRLWSATPTDVWAVGQDVHRFDGQQWGRLVGLERWPVGSNAIGGTGPNDVWVLGAEARLPISPGVFHFDGQGWAFEPLEMASPMSLVVTKTDLWVGGEWGTLMRKRR